MEIMNESQKKNNKNGTPVSHVPYNASKQHPELLYPEDKTYKHYVDESQKTFNGTPKNGTNREPPNFNLTEYFQTPTNEQEHLYKNGLDPISLREEYRNLQYLPMNANFLMPPGTGLPYMDPCGIMNPAASPPLYFRRANKTPTKKQPFRCC